MTAAAHDAMGAFAATEPTPDARNATAALPAAYWEQRPLTELIDHIVDVHHTFTRSAIARLSVLAQKVLARHEEQFRELTRVSAVFINLASELGPHMMREEDVLFPYIRALAGGGRSAAARSSCSVRSPVRVMMIQHDRTLELLHDLQAATNDFTPPPGACRGQTTLYAELAELRVDLLEHISIENEVLFPRAIAAEDTL